MKKTSLETLLHLDASRLQRAAAKLTHVGEQTEPVATIVMQTYYYLPSLETFHALRTPGVSYENDELPITLNFSVTPPNFKLLLEEAQRVSESVSKQTDSPSLSFSSVVDTPEGIQGTEILFDYEGGVALHRALARTLDQNHQIGQLVLRNQRESAYSGA